MNGAATRAQLEQLRAQETAALVKQHIPEAVPFIRDLYQHGMIAGWRNVQVKLRQGKNAEGSQ